MASSTTSSSPFSTVHQDVVSSHILSRLDSLALTSLSSTSSYFRSLSSQNTLWRNICVSTWPSLDHPPVFHLISTFPNGHRGFFSDSFPPLLTGYNQDQPENPIRPVLPLETISAVDVWYKKRPIFSRVIKTETGSTWFQKSTFRVDLLDPKEVLPTPVKIDDWDDDTWKQDLEENLRLSWIIIDPTRKRAGNFSSVKPVSVQRHWLTGEIRVEYAMVLGWNRVRGVECKVEVTCGGREEEELHVREACMQVEDMDGKYLNGKDSLGILVGAMEFGRRKVGEEEEGRKRREEYLEKKRLRREKKVLRERMLEVASVVGITILLTASILLLIGR